jgi:hypothetical protein
MGYMLKALAVAGAAALFALRVNRIMAAGFGEGAVRLLIPVVEEGLKTGSALLFGLSVPVVHIGFGLYEAGYDLLANPGVGRTRRWLAAFLAIIGHGIFGWLTWWLLWSKGSAILALALACTVHCLWNATVLGIKR